MTNTQRVRVRIAPSPTGDPHVGTAYVALFNYVFAKKHQGEFVLRIEDTDQNRARENSEALILESLKWLGLSWQEGPDCGGPLGPYRQSERTAIYQKHAEQLVASGHAYRCFLSPEEIAAKKAEAKAAGQVVNTNRFSRELSEQQVAENLAADMPYTIRLKMPIGGETVFNDQLRGEIRIDNAQVDDQILLKSDGFPTYHLANVVDDHLMKITHVIRAEEWISSTPKHVQLYRAFGWEQPQWIHLPLIRNADKSKISKRKNPVSLTYYRRAGILPETMLNFLALMGWSFGGDREVFSLQEMLKEFSWSHVSLGGPVFDQTKLNWLNQQYIQKMPVKDFTHFLREQVFAASYLDKIFPLMRERVQRFDEFCDRASFFFSGALDYQGLQILPKAREIKEFKKLLQQIVEEFDATDQWKLAEIEARVNKVKDEFAWKPRDVFMPLRLITTGRADSPPLFETLEVLGSDLVRFRLRDYMAQL